MTEYDKLKEPGTLFFRSWEKINGAQVFVNGYLLEPWDDKAQKEVQRGKNRKGAGRDWQADDEDPFP